MPTEARPYYVDQGKGCDDLMRCKDCRKLVTARTLAALGSCKCGCRKVVEIRTLSVTEWLLIRIGFIRFPSRNLFLKEFSPWRA